MSTIKIPNGHQTVMPYLMLENASRFKDFTETVFAATVSSVHFQDDDPSLIKHSEVSIGESTIMFCDSRAEWAPKPAHMFVYVENADDIYNKALESGGESVMEPADQDYGRSCGVADPCGNVWWITAVI
ncbi:glyoxalase/bleomycin resistance/extradiol dioxygenase family protein [Dyadobacter sp. CY343]|uniref:VOC family protein n=1 Tax=Dyadobacter sp. CY343 TaxID=2907299 RepID=UPI001F213B1F|nr:VOC family protein [Dyadobacter sp. CY343]MCE7058682.1 VOC family protein [Dyadobacter sp. CY343]